ncbi:hypothetical protein IJ090_02385 [Candidatus Saccharibacteria bacterium]|nr:hypothetical protein [Candidatus Saccharibacteria bacterium]
MVKEGNTQTKVDRFAVPSLYLVSVGLVITLLVLSLSFKSVPSILSGATPADISDYAYALVDASPGDGETFEEAATYFETQIAKAPDDEARFDLLLDYAVFYADTGNPRAGLDVLDEIDESDEELPADALYYLYSTYLYLYGRLGDSSTVDSYRLKVMEAGVKDYIAYLDEYEGGDDDTCEVLLLEDSSTPDDAADDSADESEEIDEPAEEPTDEEGYTEEGEQ